MPFRSIGGSRIIGSGIPQPTPITLDPAPYLGSLVYGQDGRVYASNGTAWVDIGSGAPGPQGVQGIQGVQGLQGSYGPGFTIIGSVADVDTGGDPQATLNTAFPSANIGEGVIDEADDELWIYVGSSVWVNIGSFRGVQGFQGVQGVQGMQGTIGEEGIQGSRGFRGFQGVQGLQGTTGIQGTQGIQGNQGTQGIQGVQGVQGDTGIQGTQGIQGIQGVQGPQGTTGIQGDTGFQGIAGDFGGLSYDFTYDNDTTDSDPGTGNVRFNSTNLASAGLVMYIDDEDDGGVQVTDGIMTELAGVAGPVKGYMKIVNGANIYDQATFRIDANVVDATGYWKVDVTRISGVTAFTNGTDFRISFVRNGEQGVQGIQGTTGIQGDTGVQGIQGVQGPQSVQGVQGTTGIQGDTGFQGTQGVQGVQGVQGSQGTQGVQGVQGLLGLQGIQGVQGVQGTQGVQGGVGTQGTIGSTGLQGVQGVQGIQGPQSIQGTQGIQGDLGIQGGLGVQGFTGYNGGLSYLWSFNSSTTEGFPGLNSWLLNNSDVTQATKLYIDDLTDSGRRVDELFNYLDSFTSNPKGQIFIRTPKDPATGNYQFLIYEYSDWVWGVTGTGSDWGHFVVNLIERSELEGSDLFPGTSWTLGAVPTYGNEAVFEFIPAGQRGAQGIQGTSGIQGGTGIQGAQGVQGVQGVQGIQGVQGVQGSAGSYGGSSFEYDFNSDVLPTGPGNGRFKFNNVDITAATILRISELDTFGSDISAFLASLDDNSSATKAYIKLTSVANPAEFAIYGMTSQVDAGSYVNMQVTFLSKSTNMTAAYLTLNTDTIVSFTTSGDAGVQGVQGIQGIQGIQGDTGIQGATGAGVQGAQGVQGDLGFQGVQGFPGPIGPQGIQGTSGFQGAGGFQGATGSFGGITFDYTWDTSTVASDPGVGRVKVNNASIPSGTVIYMDDRDDGFVDIQPFLRTIDDSTSPIKGHVKITSKEDPFRFAIYTISSLTELAGYFAINVAYVSGTESGSFPNDYDVTVTFARTGDIGPTGPQGIQGFQGPQGVQGLDGTLGSIGAQGIQGTQGVQGDTGFQGAIGIGTQGTQGVQGFDGFQGPQGVEGIGSQGTQGIQGAQGTQGFQGSAGFVGGTGIQGFQGVQGIQGPQGTAGNDGGDGIQGVQGIQGNDGVGAQGFQGIQGTDGQDGIGAVGIQGFQGIQGPQSIQGTQGIQGNDGPAGTGIQGIQGFQGPQGTDGSSGIQGAQGISGEGNQGIQGLQGFQGVQGDLGIQGADGAGAQGVQGFQGLIGAGATGIQGLQGIQGVQGIKGEEGVGGTQGIQGTQGFQGFQGISGGVGGVGIQGVQGIQGDFGPQGPIGVGESGIQGIQGVQGDFGIQGPTGGPGDSGIQGVQGIQGGPGFQGNDGPTGAQGSQGAQGVQGNDGFQGPPGFGDQGIQGIQGITGIQGDTGAQGVQGIQGFGNEGSVKNLQNVHTSNLQSTALFITFVEGGSTERPLLGTLGPNPGGESNFYYTSDVDTLSVENINAGGNITVTGTLTSGGATYSSDISLATNVAANFGNADNMKLFYESATTSFIFNANTSSVSNMTVRSQATSATIFNFNIATGEFLATGDVITNSDERLKENIETVDNALNKVLNMRGVYFNKKDRPEVRKVGLIAQEVEEVIPEAVSTEDEGEQIKSVSYGSLVGLLIEAIKDLNEKVEQNKVQ